MSAFDSGPVAVELSGGRELCDETKAAALLAEIKVVNPTHVRLSNKSFDNGAATKIAEYLENLSGIITADISDIIAGRPEDEALRTLTIISGALKKFDLVELNVSDNAMGAKGCLACKDILTKKTLEVIIPTLL